MLQTIGGATFSTRLVVIDVATGESRSLLDDALLQGLSWTADGKTIVVSSGRGSMMSYPATYNLWAVPVDGTPSWQLTFGESSYQSPDIDAQGNLVTSRVRSRADVWKFPVTGDPADNVRRAEQITHQTGEIQTLTASPENDEVAFLSDNGGHANVWIANVADGDMRPLTQEFDPRVVVAVPLWSPKGNVVQFLSNRNSGSRDVTLWLINRDGSDTHDLGVVGAWACWSGDGQWLYYSVLDASAYRIRKVNVETRQVVNVRDDNAVGCAAAPDGSALYYAKLLADDTGAWDAEIHVATPENGPSKTIGRTSAARIPVEPANVQPYVSPDGRLLAMPLVDGSTTNLWSLSPATGEWRKLTDFGGKSVLIPRRIAWSKDSRSIFATVSELDADIVRLVGLRWEP
jgi:Tol biopolymer transport system component